MRVKRPALLRQLAQSASGLAVAEFALVLPFLLGTGLMGLELANRALVQMQVSQLAVHLADNASRIGDTSTLEDRKIYEADINDVLLGAALQGGHRINLYDHGRVIISSLETVPGNDTRQYIHWQRCYGAKHHDSSYGDQGDGMDGTLPGMGAPGQEVTAFGGEAVIFVEIAYDYQSLVGTTFGFADQVSAIASFTVRDDRDLTQIYQRNPASPDPEAACNKYDISTLGIPS
ncbi:MAG: hypothetical protein RLZZ08_1983 [Pseudomonadota bacterium]|jgi:hypothetical protein